MQTPQIFPFRPEIGCFHPLFWSGLGRKQFCETHELGFCIILTAKVVMHPKPFTISSHFSCFPYPFHETMFHYETARTYPTRRYSPAHSLADTLSVPAAMAGACRRDWSKAGQPRCPNAGMHLSAPHAAAVYPRCMHGSQREPSIDVGTGPRPLFATPWS